MPKLDEHIIGFLGQRRLPVPLIPKALRAAPVERKIDHRRRRIERPAEPLPPTTLIVNRGIADEHNLDRTGRNNRKQKQKRDQSLHMPHTVSISYVCASALICDPMTD